MTRERLLIFGAGAQARLALNTARCMDRFDLVGLIDVYENPSIWGTEVAGTRVLGGLKLFEEQPVKRDTLVCVAIGDQGLKRDLVDMLQDRGLRFATLVHPTACLATSVKLGVGCIINAGVVIEPDARVGDHVVIRAGCVISHDVVLEARVSLSPSVTLAGRSRVETGATLYTGVIMAPSTVVGANAVVGAGSLVLKDIPPDTLAYGSPAKPQRETGS